MQQHRNTPHRPANWVKGVPAVCSEGPGASHVRRGGARIIRTKQVLRRPIVPRPHRSPSSADSTAARERHQLRAQRRLPQDQRAQVDRSCTTRGTPGRHRNGSGPADIRMPHRPPAPPRGAALVAEHAPQQGRLVVLPTPESQGDHPAVGEPLPRRRCCTRRADSFLSAQRGHRSRNSEKRSRSCNRALRPLIPVPEQLARKVGHSVQGLHCMNRAPPRIALIGSLETPVRMPGLAGRAAAVGSTIQSLGLTRPQAGEVQRFDLPKQRGRRSERAAPGRPRRAQRPDRRNGNAHPTRGQHSGRDSSRGRRDERPQDRRGHGRGHAARAHPRTQIGNSEHSALLRTHPVGPSSSHAATAGKSLQYYDKYDRS